MAVPQKTRVVALIALAIAAQILCVGCGRDHQEQAIGELFEADYAFTVDDYLRASKDGRADVLRWFLQAGMAVDAENQFGDRALSFAAERGHRDAVVVLLGAGAEPDVPAAGARTPLMGAAEAGDAATVEDLIALGADPSRRDVQGWTALRLACFYGRDDVVAILLPTARAEYLDSALLLTAVRGHVGVLDQLLAAGADIYQRTPEGQTALMLAASRGHLGAVRVLLQRGANRFATDGDGKTAAILAEEAGKLPVVSELDSLEESELAGAPLPALAEAEADLPGTVWRLDGAQLDGDLESGKPVDIGRFREVQLPLRLEAVEAERNAAAVQVFARGRERVWVQVGEQIPGLPFVVVAVNRKLAPRKGLGDLALLESATLRDLRTGRQFVVTPEDPGLSTFSNVDLIDSNGRAFRGGRGDHFVIRSRGKRVPFRVIELRPLEVLVERLDTGEVLALRTKLGSRRV